MHKNYQPLVSIFALALPLSMLACSSGGGDTTGSTAGTGPTAGGSTSGGSSNTAGTSGVIPQSGAGGTGISSGGTGSMAGSGNISGSGNVAGSGGASTGGSGGTGSAGASGSGNTGGGYTGAAGKSMGCNKDAPAVDAVGKFSKHEIHVTETIAANYLKGGDSYNNSGPYDFQFRPYSVRLPTGYDPTKSYPVIMGGGGCGGNAQDFANNPGSGYDIDKNREAIFVGLSYVAGCFADGGGGTNKRADTPEVPYVHEVLAEVKNNYCVDQSKVFITGHSSGGWESFTVGCALSNEIRGIFSGFGRLAQSSPGVPRRAGVDDGRRPGRHRQSDRSAGSARRQPRPRRVGARTRRDLGAQRLRRARLRVRLRPGQYGRGEGGQCAARRLGSDVPRLRHVHGLPG